MKCTNILVLVNCILPQADELVTTGSFARRVADDLDIGSRRREQAYEQKLNKPALVLLFIPRHFLAWFGEAAQGEVDEDPPKELVLVGTNDDARAQMNTVELLATLKYRRKYNTSKNVCSQRKKH